MIRVGDNAPVRVRSVDTETDTIVVDEPVSFLANASVFLVDSDGRTVWDKRGAHQGTQ